MSIRTVYVHVSQTRIGMKTMQFVLSDNGTWFERHMIGNTRWRWSNWKRMDTAILPPIDHCTIKHMRVLLRSSG